MSRNTSRKGASITYRQDLTDSDMAPCVAVSLLGLTWNQRIPEYDDDLDMHMTFQDLKALHQWDQTVLEGQFLVDVNPHFVYRQIRENDANIIDARVVDIRYWRLAITLRSSSAWG